MPREIDESILRLIESLERGMLQVFKKLILWLTIIRTEEKSIQRGLATQKLDRRILEYEI
ncbi:MAG: hypothetical protein QXZ17_02765 [Nitrososphaerota archaeon]